MAGLVFKPLVDCDLRALAGQMRPLDRLEFDVLVGGDPVQVLPAMIQTGIQIGSQTGSTGAPAFAGWMDGRLVCCFGRLNGTLLSGHCAPWMLATPALERPAVRRAFLRVSRKIVRALVRDFISASNLVHAHNALTIRWLKWVGARFDRPAIHISGHPFLPFDLC